MNHKLFMELVTTADADFHQGDPHTAVGTIVIVVHRTPDDDMALQAGSTVSPDVIMDALIQLMMQMQFGNATFERQEPAKATRRKIV